MNSDNEKKQDRYNRHVRTYISTDTDILQVTLDTLESHHQSSQTSLLSDVNLFYSPKYNFLILVPRPTMLNILLHVVILFFYVLRHLDPVLCHFFFPLEFFMQNSIQGVTTNSARLIKTLST